MAEGLVYHGATWNLVDDLRQLLAYPFMVHALAAGTVVAILGGVVGWFMVLRRQTFAGHTLALISFPGAAAAALAGLPLAVGYFGFCGLGALALARIARSTRGLAGESAATGTLQALALGLGFLFVGLYRGLLGGVDALLFGTFLGITGEQVVVLLGAAVVAVALLALAGRPLLFASLDPDVARAGGVPVGLLGAGFLLVLGLSVAETSQITGALLVFALLVTPAATAHRLTAEPALGLALSVVLALVVTWLGLALAFFTVYPVGFWITTLSFALYVLARAGCALAARQRATAVEAA